MDWMDPIEFSQLANDRTDKALEYITAKLYENMYAQMVKRLEIEQEDDDELVGDLEWELKGLRQTESSLHRLQSGLQSRLKLGTMGA